MKKAKGPYLEQMKNGFVVASKAFNKRVLIGIPMTGLLRAEWHINMVGAVTPCNWSQSTFSHVFDQYSPLRFLVADARNLIACRAVEEGFEWVIFIDHDVIVPQTIFINFNNRMISEKDPIVGGLYFTKGLPAEPLIYRGRGNGYFAKWKMGEEVWVDGMGLGCHLISAKIFKEMYKDAPEYEVQPGLKARRIYDTPSRIEINEETGALIAGKGTEDLPWYSKVIDGGYLGKAGWPQHQRKRYPFLCDTKMFCPHIDQNGQRYPYAGEEKQFQLLRKKDK